MLVESSARHGSGERWQRGPHAIRSLLPAFACLKHTHYLLCDTLTHTVHDSSIAMRGVATMTCVHCYDRLA